MYDLNQNEPFFICPFCCIMTLFAPFCKQFVMRQIFVEYVYVNVKIYFLHQTFSL